jgi:hypothetical protein
LKIPRNRRGQAESIILTLKEFLSCKSTSDFLTVDSEEGDKSSGSLSLKPNSFWIHPTTFIAFGGPQSFRASVLEIKIIEGVKETDPESNEPSNDEPSDDAKSLYNLLVFLWAVEQGFATSVPLSDPPDTDNYDSRCQEILDRLSPP